MFIGKVIFPCSLLTTSKSVLHRQEGSLCGLVLVLPGSSKGWAEAGRTRWRLAAFPKSDGRHCRGAQKKVLDFENQHESETIYRGEELISGSGFSDWLWGVECTWKMRGLQCFRLQCICV